MRKSRCLRRLMYPLGYMNKGYFNVALCFIDKNGEWQVGYQPLHRIVMEKHLGRKLTRKELVHHKNRDKLDSRIENMCVLTRGSHNKEHGVWVTKSGVVILRGGIT